MPEKSLNSIGEEIDPNHRIVIEETDRRVVVSVGGVEIANSNRPLLLQEGDYPATCYIPVADVRMDLLEQTDLVTHCPYKGDASYWTIRAGEQVLENGVWGYLEPLAECPQSRGYLAFYADRVDNSL